MNTLSISYKREIRDKLRIYVQTFRSQAKAAKSLEDVSEATIISMLTKDEFGWEKISDDMWRNVASQVGGVVDFNRLVETQNFQTLTLYYDVSKDNGASIAIVGNAGWGKTYTAKWYTAVNRKNNVYYLECAGYWNKKMFLQKLLMQMGETFWGMSIGEMMEALIRNIRQQDKPLIIMDEVDKLNDDVLRFFITLYNELNKICGIVWQSTDAIKKRMLKGLEKNVIGYQEIFSRIGATFVSLNQPSTDEVADICIANDIDNKDAITIICNEVKDLKGDLRRVDRSILKDKLKKGRKTSKAA